MPDLTPKKKKQEQGGQVQSDELENMLNGGGETPALTPETEQPTAPAVPATPTVTQPSTQQPTAQQPVRPVKQKAHNVTVWVRTGTPFDPKTGKERPASKRVFSQAEWERIREKLPKLGYAIVKVEE